MVQMSKNIQYWEMKTLIGDTLPDWDLGILSQVTESQKSNQQSSMNSVSG